MNRLSLAIFISYVLFVTCGKPDVNTTFSKDFIYKINEKVSYNVSRNYTLKVDSCYFKINDKLCGNVYLWDYFGNKPLKEYGFWYDTFIYVKDYKFDGKTLESIEQYQYVYDTNNNPIKECTYRLDKDQLDSGNYFLELVPHFDPNFAGANKVLVHDSSIVIGIELFTSNVLLDSMPFVNKGHNPGQNIIISWGADLTFDFKPFKDYPELYFCGADFRRGKYDFSKKQMLFKHTPSFFCYMFTCTNKKFRYPNFSNIKDYLD